MQADGVWFLSPEGYGVRERPVGRERPCPENLCLLWKLWPQACHPLRSFTFRTWRGIATSSTYSVPPVSWVSPQTPLRSAPGMSWGESWHRDVDRVILKLRCVLLSDLLPLLVQASVSSLVKWWWWFMLNPQDSKVRKMETVLPKSLGVFFCFLSFQLF